jgi:hypothetical protein
VLHKVEGENLVGGGWVGGDTWFGSVMTSVEVKKMLGMGLGFHMDHQR